PKAIDLRNALALDVLEHRLEGLKVAVDIADNGLHAAALLGWAWHTAAWLFAALHLARQQKPAKRPLGEVYYRNRNRVKSGYSVAASSNTCWKSLPRQWRRARKGRPWVGCFQISLPVRSNSSTQWPSVLATSVLPLDRRDDQAGVRTAHSQWTCPAASISRT